MTGSSHRSEVVLFLPGLYFLSLLIYIIAVGFSTNSHINRGRKYFGIHYILNLHTSNSDICESCTHLKGPQGLENSVASALLCHTRSHRSPSLAFLLLSLFPLLFLKRDVREGWQEETCSLTDTFLFALCVILTTI